MKFDFSIGVVQPLRRRCFFLKLKDTIGALNTQILDKTIRETGVTLNATLFGKG